ncbi:hypothetical protein PG994_006101 [Apiospora phragmitis]|uniref:Peptidase S54 rhomboid domain-containing protein n=1 Tax=Apiospora phragmitis TaxID=2905665 RepID=A0ABR1VGV0_9PEZI
MDFDTQATTRRRLANYHALASTSTSDEHFIRIFISVFISINTLVYGAWVYTNSKSSFQPIRGRGGSGGRQYGAPSRAAPRLIRWLTPEFMQDNFLLGTRNLRVGRWWTLLTAASLSHLAGNMAAFHTFAGVAMRLCGPVSVAAVLCLGSAAAGALAQLSDWHYRRQDGVAQRQGNVVVLTARYAQGASAITTGLAMAVTVLRPWIVVRSALLASVPLPLWLYSLGWFLYDWYELSGVMEAGSHMGHAGHLGGMAFGAAYAGLRLIKPEHRDVSFMDIILQSGR